MCIRITQDPGNFIEASHARCKPDNLAQRLSGLGLKGAFSGSGLTGTYARGPYNPPLFSPNVSLRSRRSLAAFKQVDPIGLYTIPTLDHRVW